MLIKYTDPWVHYVWENFVTFDEQKYLYDQCLSELPIKEYESNRLFYLNNELQNNCGLYNINHDSTLETKIQTQLHQMSNQLGYADKGKWSLSYNVTKDFKDKPLLPHNDDYEKLGQYGAGMLKVLVYLGNGTDDYTSWGTKLYTEESNVDSFKKEIKFQPGTCFLFEANKYSYHGTQFDYGINGYRFMAGAEYVNI
jgi:hypothetical protein